MYNIPSGEKGSINDMTRAALDDDMDFVAVMMRSSGQALNVMWNIEKYAGPEKALEFASKVIKYYYDSYSSGR